MPRFHGEYIATHIQSAQVSREKNALHFAFMDKPSMPIPTEDGDVATDPAGFDRARFLEKLSADLMAFFDKSLSQ